MLPLPPSSYSFFFSFFLALSHKDKWEGVMLLGDSSTQWELSAVTTSVCLWYALFALLPTNSSIITITQIWLLKKKTKKKNVLHAFICYYCHTVEEAVSAFALHQIDHWFGLIPSLFVKSLSVFSLYVWVFTRYVGFPPKSKEYLRLG